MTWWRVRSRRRSPPSPTKQPFLPVADPAIPPGSAQSSLWGAKQRLLPIILPPSPLLVKWLPFLPGALLWWRTVGRLSSRHAMNTCRCWQIRTAPASFPSLAVALESWGGGLTAGGSANLMDVAIMVKDAWEELSRVAIVHCWAKTKVLGVVRTADLLRLHDEYRQTVQLVSDDVDEMLQLMQGTSLGNEVLDGLDNVAQRSVVEECIDLEERPAGLVGAADAVLEVAGATPGEQRSGTDFRGGGRFLFRNGAL